MGAGQRDWLRQPSTVPRKRVTCFDFSKVLAGCGKPGHWGLCGRGSQESYRAPAGFLGKGGLLLAEAPTSSARSLEDNSSSAEVPPPAPGMLVPEATLLQHGAWGEEALGHVSMRSMSP